MKKIINNIKYLFLCLMCILLSCESLSDPGEPDIKNTVFLNLDIIKSEQDLFLYRTAKLEESIFSVDGGINNIFVEGANIKVTTSDKLFNNFIINEKQWGAKYYVDNSLNSINYNGKYKLEITAQGQNIKGETTVPGNFEILNPTNSQNIYMDSNYFNLYLKWTSSVNSNGYIINIIIPYTFNGYKENTDQTFYSTDTIFSNSFYLPSSCFEKDTVSISVTSYDENFYNYFINKQQGAGLQGAYGYFSSSVTKEVKVIVE